MKSVSYLISIAGHQSDMRLITKIITAYRTLNLHTQLQNTSCWYNIRLYWQITDKYKISLLHSHCKLIVKNQKVSGLSRYILNQTWDILGSKMFAPYRPIKFGQRVELIAAWDFCSQIELLRSLYQHTKSLPKSTFAKGE